MIGMPSLRDTALYNGVVRHFQVVYGLVYKSFNARFGILEGSYPSDNMGIYPQLSSNGANPIELLTFEFMANSVIGN